MWMAPYMQELFLREGQRSLAVMCPAFLCGRTWTAFRRVTETRLEEPVQCRERLGGLLRYYHQEAA